jgi:hypothetical protein
MRSNDAPTKDIIAKEKALTSIVISHNGIEVNTITDFGIKKPIICPNSKTTIPEWNNLLPQNNLFDSKN